MSFFSGYAMSTYRNLRRNSPKDFIPSPSLRMFKGNSGRRWEADRRWGWDWGCNKRKGGPRRNLQTKTFRGDCTAQTLGPAWKKDEIRDEKTGYDGVSSGTRGGCRRDKCDEGQWGGESETERKREKEEEKKEEKRAAFAGTYVKETHIKRATSTTCKRATKGIASSNLEITVKFFAGSVSSVISNTLYNSALSPSWQFILRANIFNDDLFAKVQNC